MLRPLSRMDINLAPLETANPFTDGKSELKIFEAALFKIPTIASPTATYRECITEGGNGLLASSHKEWFQKMEALIENEPLRKSIGRRAHRYFIDRHYIRHRIGDILGVYTKLIHFGSSGGQLPRGS
jgi:glycosyltransferase involved in cell wall biosynthesis